MLALDIRLQPNRAEVVAKVIDGEAIIMNLNNGVYYSMDGVGGFIWERIEQGCSLQGIVTALSDRYDAPEAQLREDADALLSELLAEKVVVPADGASPPTAAGTSPSGGKQAYQKPSLNTYRDMGDLLALDPPAPSMQDIPWKE